MSGRRVVISSDGGRLRLRETKRGPKTTKGRRRYTGAWREPKVLIIYVVDAEGKREASFAPVIDATLQGPDAVFALLRTYLQRLAITHDNRQWSILDNVGLDTALISSHFNESQRVFRFRTYVQVLQIEF